ncbi:MAG: hypothetical protein HZA89_04035 [Verrucomicrobia bacterium]|nr:hypothetical protein [Verrucomicrobiota bacterium]
MSPQPQKPLNKYLVCGLIVLVFSIFAPFLAKAGVKIVQVFLIPGMVLIMALGGNVHSGFGDDRLNYAVGTAGTFVFWVTLTSIVVWVVTKQSNGHR